MMVALIGAVLVLLGILGLVKVLALGLALSIVLIALGVIAVAYDRGAFRRL
jgi:hypothetical protein